MLAAGPGFTFAEPYALGVLFAGFAVAVAVAALSHQRERAFSASLIYLGLGAFAAVAISVLDVGWFDPVDDYAIIERLSEVAVVTALFGTGMQLDRALRWREWSSVTRLLMIAMPLTIAAIAFYASTVMGLSLAAALALGAVLAPTDPVLAGDVGVGPPGDEDEHEPNFSLTAEAGLNDGLAFPFVLLAIVLADDPDGAAWLDWVVADVLWAISGALVIGAGIGLFAAWSVKRLRDRDLLSSHFDGYHAIATALSVYGAAEVASTYGFLAAFAGGLAFRRYERDHAVNASVHAGAEQAEKLLELAMILLIGSLLTTAGLGVPGVEGWLLAVVLIVIIRPVSCLLALAGSKMERPYERAFVSWFGVRGIGSLYYVAIIAGAGVFTAEEVRVVVWTAIACVVVSIPVHGITAGPSVRRLIAAQNREEADGTRRPEPAPATPPAR